MYDGALADVGLSTDPFTGSRYAFGGGNPVTNIESNGHSWLSALADEASGAVPSRSDGTLSPALITTSMNALCQSIAAGACAAQTQKLDNASNAADKLALETIGIPIVDVGTGIAAGFFQGWKGVNAIQKR